MLYGEFAKFQAEAEYPELWTGLVGAWSPCLSPRGGTVLRDLSGKAKHASLANIATGSAWGVTQGVASVSLDNTDDHINLGLPYNSTSTGEKTFSAWFRVTSLATGYILSNYSALSPGGLSVLLNNNGTIGTSWTSTINVVQSLVANAIVAGKWYLLICRFAAGSTGGTISLDGRQVVAGNLGVESNGENNLRVNGRWVTTPNTGSAAMLSIQLADLLLHSGALPSVDRLLYRLGPGGWATPRRRRWNYATAQTAIPYWVFARKNARLIGGGVS